MPWNVVPSQEELAFLMEAGMVYRDAGRFSEAETVFQGVRALVPSSEVPDIALGALAFGQGKFDAAITHYQAALKLNAKSALAHAHLGEAHMLSNRFEDARQHLSRAIELDPRRESAGKYAKGVLDVLDHVQKKR